jgi:hypothetical protein
MWQKCCATVGCKQPGHLHPWQGSCCGVPLRHNVILQEGRHLLWDEPVPHSGDMIGLIVSIGVEPGHIDQEVPSVQGVEAEGIGLPARAKQTERGVASDLVSGISDEAVAGADVFSVKCSSKGMISWGSNQLFAHQNNYH